VPVKTASGVVRIGLLGPDHRFHQAARGSVPRRRWTRRGPRSPD
jgi:hypothetical protein